MPMVPAMQVLTLASLVRAIAATAEPIFHGIGRPSLDTTWQVIRLIVLVALIYPLTMRWGILGASISVLFSILISTLGFSSLVIKITECGFKSFGEMIAPPLVCSIIMMITIVIFKNSLGLSGFLEFFLLVAAGMATYFFMISLFDKFLNYGIKEIIKKSLASL